jgi:Holliday junction DNA helicase RuvA
VIASLSGVVEQARAEGRVDGRVMLACGPLTLELYTTRSHALGMSAGAETRIHTYLHFASQADVLRLYGFESALARDLFVTLLAASGVGPAAALGLINLGEQALLRAILDGDEKTLTSVPGVGPKLAKKILLELADRVTEQYGQHAVSTQAGRAKGAGKSSGMAEDAMAAVVALGYTRSRAEEALSAALASADPPADTVSLIRRLLSALSG